MECVPVTPYDPEPYPIHKRSGSQRRQCTESLQIALTPEQRAIVDNWAREAGLSASAYGKAVIFGTPGPRAQRTPHIHAEVIGHATIALNKIGVLFNQIAHVLNAGGATSMGQKYLDALADVRRTLCAMREATGRKDRDDSQGQQA
jgi:hypothetical protein